MKTTKLLLIFFVVAAAVACSKNEPVRENKKMSEDLVTYAYAQTQCADPWPTSFDDNITAQNIKNYLDAAGVEVKSVNIRRTSLEATCQACTCPSGKMIYVTTPNTPAIKARIMKLKFD